MEVDPGGAHRGLAVRAAEGDRAEIAWSPVGTGSPVDLQHFNQHVVDVAHQRIASGRSTGEFIDGEVRPVSTMLASVRDVVEIALSGAGLVGTGILGAIAKDIWSKTKDQVGEGPAVRLDRGYADHLARWALTTEFSTRAAETGIGDLFIEEELTLRAERRISPDCWKFEYELKGWRYSATVQQPREFDHGVVVQLEREQL